MNKKKVVNIALAAAILASSGGFAGAVVTAAPAEAATITTNTTSAPVNLKAFTDAVTLQSGVTFAKPTRIVGTITHYTVTLKQTGKADRVFSTKSERFVFGAPLAGLAENTSYTVQVKANLVSSTGAKSTSAVASTAFKTGYANSTVKPASPASLKVTDVGETSFVTRWSAPTGYVGTVTGYTVTVKKAGVTVKTANVSSSARSYKANSLKAASAYTVEVKATFASVDKTKTATSSPAKASATTNPTAVVSLRPVLTVSNITSNSADLSWKPIPGAMTYLTFVSEKGAGLVSRSQTSPDTTSESTGPYLKPNTTYLADVQVVVPTADGKSWVAYSSGVTEFTTAK